MKNLKKSIFTILLLVILCGLSACEAKEDPMQLEENNSPEQEMATEWIDDELVLSVDESISNIENNNLYVHDVWTAIQICNQIPFCPEGYDGPMCDYEGKYTSKNGITTQKTYENVAFIPHDENDYEGDGRYATTRMIDGEMVYGYFIFHREYLYFLVHVKGDDIEHFYLDIDFPCSMQDITLLGRTDERAIIRAGSYIFTYDFNLATCNILTNSAFMYRVLDEDVVLFIDWDHIEYQCKWKENDRVLKTGNTVFSYTSIINELSINKDFQDEFLEIQEDMKSGIADEFTYDEKYYISYSKNIFRVDGYSYLGNLHLPSATNWAEGTMMSDFGSCWLVERTNTTLYRYGDEVRSYDLTEGTWKIVKSYLDIRIKPDSSVIEYDIDPDGDGVITAAELDDAIINLELLLFNLDEHAIYRINSKGEKTKIANDVQDYCEIFGMLYWMDSNYSAYKLSWMQNDESVLIGKDVVGISKDMDERAGFLVKPDDPRCNFTDEGYYYCILYG